MRATRSSSTLPTRRRSPSKPGSARRSKLRRHVISRGNRNGRGGRTRHEPGRSNAPTPSTRSRMAIENSMASGDVDRAEQELGRADESFNPGAEFADLRARVLELRREAALRQDGAPSRSSRSDLRRSGAPGSVAEQVVEQDLRREPGSPSSQPQAVTSVVGQPRVLWAAAALFVVAGAAFWLVPLALNRSPQPPPKVCGSAGDGCDRANGVDPGRVRVICPAPGACRHSAGACGTAPAGPETAPAQPGPSAAEPATSTAPPDTAAEPPAATAGAASPTTVAVPNETIVANFLKHVQTLLAKKEPELALSVLTDALAYAPADKGLRAMGPKILEQAQATARQERSKALAKGASARPKFKQADRTMQSALALSGIARPRRRLARISRLPICSPLPRRERPRAALLVATRTSTSRKPPRLPSPSLLPSSRRRRPSRRRLLASSRRWPCSIQ